MPDLRPTPQALVSKVANRVRARGIGEVVRLARDRIVEGISSHDELIFFVRPAGEAPPPSDALAFVEATSSDASRYARDIGTDSASTFVRRLSDRTTCFFALSDGTIVHATWATTAAAWTRELRSYVRPPQGDAYVYESFTRPDARGKGVYPFVLRHIAAALAARGLGRVWVAVEADNDASKRAVVKAGFSEAFRVRYRRSLGRLKVEEPTGEMAEAGSGFLSHRP